MNSQKARRVIQKVIASLLGLAVLNTALIYALLQVDLTIAFLEQKGWRWCLELASYLEDSNQWDDVLSKTDVVVPFRQDSHDGPMLIKIRLGSISTECFFDTGCETVLIDPRLASRVAGAELNAPLLTEKSPKFIEKVVALQDIALDKLRVKKVYAFVTPTKKAWGCELIVGPSVFGRCAITIDYKNKRIIFQSPVRAAESGGTVVASQNWLFIPGFLGAKFTLPCVVEGRRHSFWLDTGSNTNLFYQPGQSRLPREQKKIKMISDTVTGPIKFLGYASAKAITFADATYEDIPIVIVKTPFSNTSEYLNNDFNAVLGRPFLSRVRVTLDYKNMVARLHRY